jgi:hypothetical protein
MEGSLAKRRPQGMEGEGDPGRAVHRGVTTARGWRAQAMDGVGTCHVETGERGGVWYGRSRAGCHGPRPNKQ